MVAQEPKAEEQEMLVPAHRAFTVIAVNVNEAFLPKRLTLCACVRVSCPPALERIAVSRVKET